MISSNLLASLYVRERMWAPPHTKKTHVQKLKHALLFTLSKRKSLQIWATYVQRGKGDKSTFCDILFWQAHFFFAFPVSKTFPDILFHVWISRPKEM